MGLKPIYFTGLSAGFIKTPRFTVVSTKFVSYLIHLRVREREEASSRVSMAAVSIALAFSFDSLKQTIPRSSTSRLDTLRYTPIDLATAPISDSLHFLLRTLLRSQPLQKQEKKK